MDFLVNNFNVDNIKITKPKKINDQYLLSKVKYETSENDIKLNIQFPKMKITHIENNNIILNFEQKNGSYTNKCIEFIKQVEEKVIDVLFTNSLKWFGKEIPKESIIKMYKPMINENLDMKFVLSKQINGTDFNGNEIGNIKEELKLNTLIENICIMKYLMFSKETVFILWEIQSIKLNKKKNKVIKKDSKHSDFAYYSKYNFIDFNDSDSEDEDSENLEFRNNLINNNSFF